MAPPSPIRRTGKSEIPDKLYFRIGEVARLCEVPPYVLRFWESEFPQLKPNKGGTGQRLYRRKDAEMAMRIKRLLYDEGYTIPGARQVFKSEVKQKEPELFRMESSQAVPKTDLSGIRKNLQEIADLLSRPSPGTAGKMSKARTMPSARQTKVLGPKPETPPLF
jgi:DNA-binding transcriptional MerR regulator